MGEDRKSTFNVPCLICGGVSCRPIYEFDFCQISSCRGCGFARINPLPERPFLEEEFAGDYWTAHQKSVGEEDIFDRIDEFLEISKERIDYLKPYKRSGRFLDVGCSMGFLVKAAKDAGFNALGVDLSEKIAAEGRRHFGVAIETEPIEDLPLDPFDAIASYNTIEHVVRPDQFLMEMVRRLPDDGVVVIGTHDFECETHKREGRSWKHIVPNDHLYYFREVDLVRMGEQAGLTKIAASKPIDNLIVVYFKKRRQP